MDFRDYLRVVCALQAGERLPLEFAVRDDSLLELYRNQDGGFSVFEFGFDERRLYVLRTVGIKERQL